MKSFLRLQKLFVLCCIMLLVVIVSSQAALAQPLPGFTVAYASPAPCKADNFTVVVRGVSNGNLILIEDATVTLVKDWLLVDSKQTASEYPDHGTAKFSFNLSAGTMYIIVTKHGYKTYVGTCTLTCGPLDWIYRKSLWVSWHAGGTIVWEKYQDYFELHGCFNAIINLEYRWRLWSVVLDIGYNEFKLKEFDRHYHWWNITPSIRYHIPMKRFKPFINVGPGLYIPREGNNRFGFKAGLGFDYDIGNGLLFEMGTDYHQVFSKKGDANFGGKKFAFQHFHVGVIYCLNRKG